LALFSSTDVSVLLLAIAAVRSIQLQTGGEVNMQYLVTGLSAPNLAITLLRLSMGVFFVFSGYHKLFNKQRHAVIAQTMAADRIPDARFNSWFVPGVEFLGGLALFFGFLTSLAAFGLVCVCCVATLVDGLKRIPAWSPIDKADYADDVLYLPEVLYSIILLAIIFTGPGPYSLDDIILRYVWGL
jgi:uncharacterized membrane protein YphA (DoxX/SURF4 family)